MSSYEISDTEDLDFDIFRIIFGDKCIKKMYFPEYDEEPFTLKKLYDIAVENGYSAEDERIITVIAEGPLSGKIFQYGNYGEFWVDHGTTKGYW